MTHTPTYRSSRTLSVPPIHTAFGVQPAKTVYAMCLRHLQKKTLQSP